MDLDPTNRRAMTAQDEAGDERDRRGFLKTVALTAGALATTAVVRAATSPDPESEDQAAGATPSEEPMPPLRLEPLTFPWSTPDPFLFCVHHLDHYPRGDDDMGPATSLEGRQLGSDFSRRDGWSMYHGQVVPGFPRHPHRGFETVTVTRSGYVDHSDSLGATARYGNGDAQWMTAGRGIVHAEMFPLREREADNPMELFQIWLNLPAASKRVEPHFAMFWQQEIPRHEYKDDAGRVTTVTTIAGSLDGRRPPSPPPSSWASRRESEVAIWSIVMPAESTWVLPAASSGGLARSLYFYRGDSIRVREELVRGAHRIDLDSDQAVTLTAGRSPCELLLLQGRPIGEPVASHGPFVMNTSDEIRQAYTDYQRDGFGGWKWSSDAPVHPREAGRFAIHADGRRDEPA